MQVDWHVEVEGATVREAAEEMKRYCRDHGFGAPDRVTLEQRGDGHCTLSGIATGYVKFEREQEQP